MFTSWLLLACAIVRVSAIQIHSQSQPSLAFHTDSELSLGEQLYWCLYTSIELSDCQCCSSTGYCGNSDNCSCSGCVKVIRPEEVFNQLLESGEIPEPNATTLFVQTKATTESASQSSTDSDHVIVYILIAVLSLLILVVCCMVAYKCYSDRYDVDDIYDDDLGSVDSDDDDYFLFDEEKMRQQAIKEAKAKLKYESMAKSESAKRLSVVDEDGPVPQSSLVEM